MAVPSGAPAHLCHLLERPLKGAEVGEVNQIVRADDAHHTHMVEVQPFGNHLCTYQYVDATVLKVVDDFQIAVLLQGAVQVHTCHLGIGEENAQVVLDAFGAEPFHGQVVAIAGGAFRRQGDAVAAIVATQGVGGLVIHQRHVAVLAVGCPVTVVALYAQRETPSVLEKYHLFVVVEGLLDVFQKKLGEVG